MQCAAPHHNANDFVAFLEAAAELDVRVAPQECALLHPLRHPVADGRVLELLEGVDVGEVRGLDVLKGGEGVSSFGLLKVLLEQVPHRAGLGVVGFEFECSNSANASS